MISIKSIELAEANLRKIISPTPLLKNDFYSNKYNCNIFFKREDLNIVRSYKIRGAYNKISSLTKEDIKNGIVCASAGNHAQGVAYSASLLKINATIFMPTTTPTQKIKKVNYFGKNFVKIILIGDTFDDTAKEANRFCLENNSIYISPFDDEKIIEGQGTLAFEVMEQFKNEKIDYVVAAIGGGGMMAGIISFFKEKNKDTKFIGVEPFGAPKMKKSIEAGKIVELEKIDSFIDGAATKKPGILNFEICKNNLDEIVIIKEGHACSIILELYNQEGITIEPAGALPIAALEFIKDKIKGKNVICVLGGGNNDIMRMEEIKERSMLYEGLKHYFIFEFPQRAGALKEFLNFLGPNDDIAHFEYQKKNNREKGPVLIGIELKYKEDFLKLMDNFNKSGFNFEYINDKPTILQLLI